MKDLLVRAEVAGEQQVQSARAVFDVQLDRGGAKDVPGIPEARPHAGARLDPLLVAHALDLTQAVLGIPARIDRRDRVSPAAPVAPVQLLDLALLDVAAVREHEREQVRGRLGGMDRALEAMLGQLGQQTAVIDVGVGQQHEIDGVRLEGKVP